MPVPLMIFAAGFGTRMGALCAHRPKPLIEVAGVTLLDRALALADAAGCAPVVVNCHYHGQQIIDHLRPRPEIAISDERARILETGGGLRRALPLLAPATPEGPVMTINPDVIWCGPNPLALLQRAFDPQRMDSLLLVLPRAGLPGRKGNADFATDAKGRIQRTRAAEGSVYLGAQILSPAGLEEIEAESFSLNLLWDKHMARGRAFALTYPGQWCDVGSPEGLHEAEALLARQAARA